jgi:O-antigen/teichoic acid export membrane protein
MKKVFAKQLHDRVLNSKFLRDSFWALGGNVMGKGLALVAGIVVARFLGKEIYGEYGIIKNTIISFSIFSTFGLGYTATKYVAEYKKSKPELIAIILKYSQGITLLVSGIMAILLFVFSVQISEFVLKAAHLSNSIRLISVWIILNAFTTTQIGVLAGFGAFKEMAKINVIIGIISFIFSVTLTYFYGLNGALLALLVAQMANLFLNKKAVKKCLLTTESYSGEKLLLKEILKFSFPVALQEVTYSTFSWLLSFLIITYSSYGELGLFSAAMHWNALVLFIPGILRNVILSHLSENTSSSNRHNRILKLTLVINFFATFFPFLLVWVFADLITKSYGPTFQGLEDVLKISVLATTFISLSNVYTQAYMSKGRNWLMFGFRLIRDIGKIAVAYYFLISFEGMNGAKYVSSTILFMSVVFLTLMALVYHLHISIKSKNSF